MGYMVHHAIIVTSFDEKMITETHAFATGMFGASQVTPVIQSPTNFYHTFFVAPDGSKAGWIASEDGDERRKQFIEYMNAQAYEDDSNCLDFAEVQYGDEQGDDRVLATPKLQSQRRR